MERQQSETIALGKFISGVYCRALSKVNVTADAQDGESNKRKRHPLRPETGDLEDEQQNRSDKVQSSRQKHTPQSVIKKKQQRAQPKTRQELYPSVEKHDKDDLPERDGVAATVIGKMQTYIGTCVNTGVEHIQQLIHSFELQSVARSGKQLPNRHTTSNELKEREATASAMRRDRNECRLRHGKTRKLKSPMKVNATADENKRIVTNPSQASATKIEDSGVTAPKSGVQRSYIDVTTSNSEDAASAGRDRKEPYFIFNEQWLKNVMNRYSVDDIQKSKPVQKLLANGIPVIQDVAGICQLILLRLLYDSVGLYLCLMIDALRISPYVVLSLVPLRVAFFPIFHLVLPAEFLVFADGGFLFLTATALFVSYCHFHQKVEMLDSVLKARDTVKKRLYNATYCLRYRISIDDDDDTAVIIATDPAKAIASVDCKKSPNVEIKIRPISVTADIKNPNSPNSYFVQYKNSLQALRERSEYNISCSPLHNDFLQHDMIHSHAGKSAKAEPIKSKHKHRHAETQSISDKTSSKYNSERAVKDNQETETKNNAKISTDHTRDERVIQIVTSKKQRNDSKKQPEIKTKHTNGEHKQTRKSTKSGKAKTRETPKQSMHSENQDSRSGNSWESLELISEKAIHVNSDIDSWTSKKPREVATILHKQSKQVVADRLQGHGIPSNRRLSSTHKPQNDPPNIYPISQPERQERCDVVMNPYIAKGSQSECQLASFKHKRELKFRRHSRIRSRSRDSRHRSKSRSVEDRVGQKTVCFKQDSSANKIHAISSESADSVGNINTYIKRASSPETTSQSTDYSTQPDRSRACGDILENSKVMDGISQLVGPHLTVKALDTARNNVQVLKPYSRLRKRV